MCVSEHVGGKYPPTHPLRSQSTDHTHSPSAQIWLSASISTLATADCSFGGYLISLLFEQSTVSFHYHSILSNLQWDLSLQFCFTPTLNGASNLLLLSSDFRFPIHNIVQQQTRRTDKFSLLTRSDPLPHFLLGGLPPVAPPFSSSRIRCRVVFSKQFALVIFSDSAAVRSGKIGNLGEAEREVFLSEMDLVQYLLATFTRIGMWRAS